jgi:LacI family transcriptional regulator
MVKKDELFSEITIEDLARITGFSKSTVSRVVTNHPNVNPETRSIIEGAIRKYKYKPNLAGRALVKQRLQVIGVLIPHVVSHLFTDPFFPRLLQAVTIAANLRGYNVTLWLSSAEVAQHTFYDQMLNPTLADGLIIASAVIDYPLLKRLDQLQKPYVMVGRPNVEIDQVNYVDAEGKQGAYLMTRHLIERGRQRIGLIPGLQDLTSSQDRQEGFLMALHEAGLSTEFIGPPGNYQEQGGYHSMKYLLHRNVDAVFAASDMMAVGALRAISEAGLYVPQDIAMGGFDDMPFAATTSPPLTTIRQPIAALGSSAVEGLLQILEEEAPEVPYRRFFPVELVVRESTI